MVSADLDRLCVFRQEWPEECLTPPGLAGEVAKWILGTSRMRQPKFALAAALTVCGSLAGRAVKDPTGQTTRLYALAVGATSAGKNHPLSASGKLVSALGAKILLAGEPTSDSAIETLVSAYPVRLFLLDEVGHYLGSVKRAGLSNGHLRTVMPALTKMWSADPYLGKARAPDSNGKWTPPRQIQSPCACLYGTSAPDALFDCMMLDDFKDGSIPRYLAFISESRPKGENRPDAPVPQELLTEMNRAMQMLGASHRPAENADGTASATPKPPTPRNVPTSPEAEAVFAKTEQLKDEALARGDGGEPVFYLFGKTAENARRIALTVAAFDNPGNPSVEKKHAVFGARVAQLCAGEMVAYARARVASNATERTKKGLLLTIKASGASGITKSELTRKTQALERRQRDEALTDLLEAGEIVETLEPGDGRKTVARYTCAMFADGARQAT